MKLAAFALTLIPGIAIASSWTSPGFPTFSTQETGRFTSHAALTKGTRALTLHIDQQCWQPSGAIKTQPDVVVKNPAKARRRNGVCLKMATIR